MFLPFAHATGVVSIGSRLALPYGITIATGVNGGIIGSLTPSNTPQLVNSFATYANGTIWFNATSLELGEPSRQLAFTRTTYGNGTMVVKVQTIISPNIFGIFQKVSYANNLLVLTFTDGNSNGYSTPLNIVWGGLSSNLLTAAVIVGFLLGPLLVLIAVWKTGNLFTTTNHRRFGAVGDSSEGTNIPLAAIVILSIMLLAALLAIGLYRGL